MAFYPHQHFKREGAKQTAVCEWCGQWVNVQDLIECDVEGFRGYRVCSSHPWEKDKRAKPSFLDRGGVGQVIDPGHDMLPAPGGFWFDLPEDNMIAAFKSASQSVTSSTTPTADTSLHVEVAAGHTYWFRMFLYETFTGAGQLQLSLNGSSVVSSLVASLNTTNLLATGYGQTLVSPSSDGVCAIEGSIVVTTGGTFGLYFTQAVSDPTPVTIRAGSWLAAFLIS